MHSLPKHAIWVVYGKSMSRGRVLDFTDALSDMEIRDAKF